MDSETELDMVRRHVREGEGHVKRQGEIVAELHAQGAPTDMAITLLEQFKDLQRQHKGKRRGGAIWLVSGKL